MQELTKALESPRGITRRRMVGFLIAAPTLIAAARWNLAEANAALPTAQPADAFDLPDLLTLAAAPPPALLSNQRTAGANTIQALNEPVRTAAAAAREQLQRTAAREL